MAGAAEPEAHSLVQRGAERAGRARRGVSSAGRLSVLRERLSPYRGAAPSPPGRAGKLGLRCPRLGED